MTNVVPVFFITVCNVDVENFGNFSPPVHKLISVLVLRYPVAAITLIQLPPLLAILPNAHTHGVAHPHVTDLRPACSIASPNSPKQCAKPWPSIDATRHGSHHNCTLQMRSSLHRWLCRRSKRSLQNHCNKLHAHSTER